MTIFAGTGVCYFCGLAPKHKLSYSQTLVCVFTEALGSVDPVPFPHTNCLVHVYITRKACLSQNRRKINVPANNCHLKVVLH